MERGGYGEEGSTSGGRADWRSARSSSGGFIIVRGDNEGDDGGVRGGGRGGGTAGVRGGRGGGEDEVDKGEREEEGGKMEESTVDSWQGDATHRSTAYTDHNSSTNSPHGIVETLHSRDGETAIASYTRGK